MQILKVIAAVIGIIASVAIIVIALLEVAARHMSMNELGGKILGDLIGFIIGVCIAVAAFTLVDWSCSIGHPLIAVVFFLIVAIAFFIVVREEKEK